MRRFSKEWFMIMFEVALVSIAIYVIIFIIKWCNNFHY